MASTPGSGASHRWQLLCTPVALAERRPTPKPSVSAHGVLPAGTVAAGGRREPCPARVHRSCRRRLHERRWREKLGLFVCEGEDLVEAATAEPVELLVAGENVEPRCCRGLDRRHPPRVIGVYRRETFRRRAAAGDARALAPADPGTSAR